MALIILRHNIEVAHRLFELPGKCENIHGHSMWVEVQLYGGISHKGLLQTDSGEIEFGEAKRIIRGHLDQNYDHRLLLNEADPYAQGIWPMQEGQTKLSDMTTENPRFVLPGLMCTPGDPTTENLAFWFAEKFSHDFKTDCTVRVQETHVNAAEVSYAYEGATEGVCFDSQGE